MATPKKKHIIELMIEAGVKWPDGAEYAAQDKDDNKVQFYADGAPNFKPGNYTWQADNCVFLGYKKGYTLHSLCHNWHQTIVTREQYAEALALAQHRTENFAARPPKTLMCRCSAAPVSLTIEQLTAEYHAKAAEADRLQYVADEALKAADDALLALEKAGELLGLVISVDTKPKLVEQPPEITDWRDLRVGDVVEYVRGTISSREGKQGEVCKIDENDNHHRVQVMFNKKQDEQFWCSKWRFIRRP